MLVRFCKEDLVMPRMRLVVAASLLSLGVVGLASCLAQESGAKKNKLVVKLETSKGEDAGTATFKESSSVWVAAA